MRACSSTPPKQNQDFVKEHNRTPLRKIKERVQHRGIMSTLASKESSPENGAQLEENKTRGISYCLAGKYPILQKIIKNC